MSKCLSIDRKNDNCRRNALMNTRFCKIHSYMADYTEDMLQNLSICSGCNKAYYLTQGVKTCSNCNERSKSNKITAKSGIVQCAKDNCSFKRSTENKYCGKHQLYIFVDETVASGKKVCINYVRGCRTQLDIEYSKTSCETCLGKDRANDKARRGNSTALNSNNEPDKQTCTTCCKTYDKDQFIGKKSENTKTCSVCREACRVQDLNRDKKHRNELARIAEQKPERKAIKNEWTENNPEKVAMKEMNYRQRQLENDQEGYLQRNAETAKNWREQNPEKVMAENKSRIENIKIHYSNYIRKSGYARQLFELSQDMFDQIVKQSCYYCGIVQDRGFNGVDRKDSTEGYTESNCVSCCKMCNYMKGSLSERVFLDRIEHILTFNAKIEGRLFPDAFCNYNSAQYSEYEKRAVKKGLDFVLSKDEFDVISSNSCYLCNKECSSTHHNGLDRIDNSKGYIEGNVKSCCGGCNFMKRDYSVEDIFDKFIAIYNFNIQSNNCTNTILSHEDEIVLLKRENTELKQRVEYLTTTTTIGLMHINKGANKNKKTDEEKREAARIKKQEQRKQQKEKYGDEEYKKKVAAERAARRKNAKENK
jgi:hypothetical protein